MSDSQTPPPSPSRDAARCLVCRNPLDAEVVWCADCDTPHHKDCFAYAGRCALFGCACLRYRDKPGTGKGVTLIEVKDPDGNPVPQSYIVDFESPREAFFAQAGLVQIVALFLLGAYSFVHIVPTPLWVVLTLGAVACLCLRSSMEDYWVFDSKTRTLWLHRAFLGSKSLVPFENFKALRDLTLRHRVHYDVTVVSGGREISDPAAVPRFSSNHTWDLSLGLEGGRRISLGFAEEAEMPQQLLSIARLLERITGLSLSVKAVLPEATPPPSLPPARPGG